MPQDLGPIRLCAIDQDGERYDAPDCGPLTDWVLMTASGYPRRYVRIAIMAEPAAARYWLANGLDILQYLLDHPEIDAL